jgi:hypothetical protein
MMLYAFNFIEISAVENTLNGHSPKNPSVVLGTPLYSVALPNRSVYRIYMVQRYRYRFSQGFAEKIIFIGRKMAGTIHQLLSSESLSFLSSIFKVEKRIEEKILS